MKKIIAIAGSNNKNSQTYRLLNLWLEGMSRLDRTVEYEVLLLRDFPLAICEGCKVCQRKGRCVLDEQDDMPLLRKKLRESSILVFSSPVYHQNMSGIMKNFIDRVAVDAPDFALAGKLGFTLTTTNSCGGQFVSDMLRQIQTSFGIRNLDNFVFRGVCDDEAAASAAWARAAVEDLRYQLGQ